MMLDLILLSIVCISTIIGFWSGIIRSLISVCSFVGAIVIAVLLYPFTLAILSDHMSSGLFLTFSAAILSYAVSATACNVLQSILNHSLFIISRGIIDRLLGMVFGCIRGVVISLLLYIVLLVCGTGNYMDAEDIKDLEIFDKTEPKWIYDSTSFEYLKKLSTGLENNHPGFYREIMSTNLPSLGDDTEDLPEEYDENTDQGYNILKNIF